MSLYQDVNINKSILEAYTRKDLTLLKLSLSFNKKHFDLAWPFGIFAVDSS